VPKPNPGKPGDDKNLKRKKNEFNTSEKQRTDHAAYAYAHVQVNLLSSPF